MERRKRAAEGVVYFYEGSRFRITGATPPGQSHLKELAVGIWRKAACEVWRRSNKRPQAARNLAGAKARLLLYAFCGTT
jgi:hypothetical protein